MKTVLSKEYLTGIAHFDLDHADMLDYLNEIGDSINADQLIIALQKVIGEWIFHMMDEEAFMRRINYPGYELHALEHSNLLEALKEVKYSLKHDQMVLDETMVERIKIAMLLHIKDSDVLYGKFYATLIEENNASVPELVYGTG